jgi:multidrug efflux pump subunit AcrA (membrane-fusion protein)
MTKSTLFDRLNQELEAFGKKAQAALDEGKLQIELLRHRRRQDQVARELGMLVYRRERGGELEANRIEALLLRLDDIRAQIGKLEQQISDSRRGAKSDKPPRSVPAHVGPESSEPPNSP